MEDTISPITIKFNPKSEGKSFYGWSVKQGDRMADCLAYDEMMGLISSLTMPKERPCLSWMKPIESKKKNTNL